MKYIYLLIWMQYGFTAETQFLFLYFILQDVTLVAVKLRDTSVIARQVDLTGRSVNVHKAAWVCTFSGLTQPLTWPP